MSIKASLIPAGVILAILILIVSPAHSATVAYWRFETGPAGAVVAHSGADGAFSGTTADVSGNGNSLSAWTAGGYAGFLYRSNVPYARVPQNGVTNRFSVQNTGGYPAMFTSAAGSSPTGINAETMTPAQFTVEASYKAEASASYRTVVGRDAINLSSSDGNLAAFYLQVRPDDSVCVTFTDVSGYTHRAYSPPGWIYGFNYSTNPQGTNTPWYNFAAVSDGNILKLYVNFVLVGTNDMTASGSPNRALAKGSTSGSDWNTGAWSVGRGLYAGSHRDRAYGFIDEVRISDSALSPEEFLSCPRPRIDRVNPAGTNLVMDISGAQSGTTVYLLQSTNLVLSKTGWSPANFQNADTNGSCSFTIPVNTGIGSSFYSVKANVSTAPVSGALTYSLASGSASWPADARARIIYIMDGAVAQYNRYGTFTKHLTVNLNSGVPTAQANYDGWIEFGTNASYQTYRTALHETSHTLGVGTTWQWRANLSVPTGTGTWVGANGEAQIQALDGAGAVITSDGTHFWPYGLNYESEGNTENYRRHVLMMRAFRRDMGIE